MSPLLQDYLTRSVERHPEKVAVVMGGDSLTYGELELESNRLARLLIDSGCRRGDRVCLLLPKSLNAIAGIIAVLKADAVYVPIDASSPAPRVAKIIEVCRPRLVLACDATSKLTDELVAAGALGRDLGVGLLDDSHGGASEPIFRRADWIATSADRLSSANSSEDLAHLLFTSGSTGVPKGVKITHSSIIHFVEWATAYFGTKSSDRISGQPPLHFDLSTFDLYGTFLAGAELHLTPATANLQPGSLADFIRDGRLTQWFSVPSALVFMAKHGVVRQHDFPHLKRVIFAGEVLPTPTLIEWMGLLPHVEFTNLYGPTEATIASSYYTMPEPPADPTAPIPIGRACLGEELAVMDDDMRPVPAGEIGEIYIGGVGLSPGYWGDEVKTAAAFRAHPTSDDATARLYRTGDLGRVGEQDGLLYYLGRVDSQIKSRGYRIELGEIEAALNAQSILQECAVVGIGTGGFEGTAICCAYAPAAGNEISDVELKNRLAKLLPSYMLPSRWLALRALPRNPNGKIDRRKLTERFEAQARAATSKLEGLDPKQASEPVGAPAGDGSRLVPAAASAAVPGAEDAAGSLVLRLGALPEGEWDAVLVEVVRSETAAILGFPSPDTVELERAFSDLGLDSLSAVLLADRLSVTTGLRLPSTLVFDHPSPTAVVEYLRQQVAGTTRGFRAPSSSPSHTDEPIAIVGMSCRYPGGIQSPGELWTFVTSGADAIDEFPTDRGWDMQRLYDPDPDHPGTSYTRHGGFLYDAADFDADHFSVAPREALAMDPQQWLLLEGAWEAFEDAGMDPLSLRESQIGVFVGVASAAFGFSSRMPQELEGYVVTGGAASVLSGRIAYTFGLEGPAVTVDTACSSSLVALHLACQSLRGGECSMAMAGGVTVMSTPGTFIGFSRQRGLAVDGRCKSFADAADGAGFSEGTGMVVLERLSDAVRNGHQVLALVKGSAINQDGASNGLTAPNGPSQQRVIAQALASAGLSASDVDVVEAHGTGTTLGDPIEAQALLASYGQDRPDGKPLRLGSIKSNIGHTQAAAGVAGVIKMVMALKHGLLPKTLHVDEPSSRVDWSTGSVALLTEAMPWEANAVPRRAGVSSFGVSGTNAHVILEEAPPIEQAPSAQGPAPVVDGQGSELLTDDSSAASTSAPVFADASRETGPVPWMLSAKSEQALRAQAQRLSAQLEISADLDPADIGFSLTSRSSFEHRAVVLGAERKQLEASLDALARGDAAPGTVRGLVGEGASSGGLVFLFPGQGSQWDGMALELLDSSPAFAKHMRDCEAALAPYVDFSLEEVLRGAEGAPGLNQVDVIQPLLFAVMVSLAGLWNAAGVRPDLVIGHSQGEIAAAHVAGALSLEDAARVVALRSRALTRLSGSGGMLSIALGAQAIVARLERWDNRISLAAVNGPASVVVSGESQALGELLGECESEAVRARMIPVDYAAHSQQVEAIEKELLDGCSAIEPRSSEIPFCSAVTGELLDTAELDAKYWYRNLRETVQFERATRAVLEQGHRVYVEISPHPVLTVGLQATVEQVLADPEDVVITGTLRREEGGPGRFLTSLSELWVQGTEVDWAGVFQGSGAKRVTIPTYPFQRQRFWLKAQAGTEDITAAGQASADHPLLGAALALAGAEGRLFTGRLSLDSHPWLNDHAVLGTVLLPGTVFLELALHAGDQTGCETVQELTLEAPLVLPETGGVQIQVSVDRPDDAGQRAVSIHSRSEHTDAGEGSEDQERWTRNASGVLAPADRLSVDGQRPANAQIAALAGSWPPRGAEPVEIDDLYDRLADLGLDYGPAFRGLTAAWRRGEEIFAEVCLPSDQQEQAASFGMHPALLDTALQATAVAWLDRVDGDKDGAEGQRARPAVRMPFSWRGVSLVAAGATGLRVCLSVVAAPEQSPTDATVPAQSMGDVVSMAVADQSGALVAAVGSLAMREVSREQLAAARRDYHESLFCLDWTPIPSGSVAQDRAPEAVEWAFLGSEGSPIVKELEQAGVSLTTSTDLGSLVEALDGDLPIPELVLIELTGTEEKALGGIGDARADSDAAGIAHASAQRMLEVLQAWLADVRFGASRLVLVTDGAVAVSSAETLRNLGLAPVWGMVRSAQSEHPERFVLVDLDDEEDSVALLPAALAAASVAGESQLAIRKGEVLVPRLTRVAGSQGGALADRDDQAGSSREDAVEVGDGSAAASEVLAFDPGHSVLITGGTGELGGLLARHLVVEHGVQSLILTSRRGAEAPGAPELERELESMGAQVALVACDVSDRSELRALLSSIPQEHPLGAVIHAAAVLDDGAIDSLTPERLDSVLAPKLDAAWHLHELTEHHDLRAFVLFSSTAATLGSPGQGNYAAANAFLDALASYRRARGLPGTSLAWGLWEQLSQLTGSLSEADLSRMKRRGMQALSSEEGLELFDAACAMDEALLLPMRVDTAALRSQARTGTVPALLRGLIHTPTRRAAETGSLGRRLAGVPEAERESIVLELVRTQIATGLGHTSPAAIDPKRTFKELGFDSLTAVELRNRLNTVTGLRLHATLAFDYPTPRALTGYLLKELAETGDQVFTPTVTVAVDEPIAIVGMSCRYPGGVASPQELWERLVQCTDVIAAFPSNRGWDLEGLYNPDPDHPGTSYARDGGFLYDADEFDAAFFGISPREAVAMDPQQRLLLEGAWEAFEDAGIDSAALRGSKTGVFAGVMHGDYGMIGPQAASSELERYLETGVSGSVTSGRLAYTFGLEGPAVTVDTACSSSLVALHFACQSLRAGECSMALAGGVTVMSTPGMFRYFSRQRGLSADGRCRSFGAGADGTGFSEGVGMLVLERLSEAERNGHRVLGLVRGSAVNQDGASNGLTAPNGPAQERVIVQALASAGLAAGEVDVVEGHGTGTTLGDPIEAQALLATYGQGRAADRPLWLGSVKSNIGHTQAAAGVAGVIKMVMAMRHGVLPKTLHAEEPSPHVDWSAGAVSLLAEEVSWQRNGKPRRAGVSSFGVSGTNAHVILEDAPSVTHTSHAQRLAANGEAILPSADGEGLPADQDFPPAARPGFLPFLVSASSEEALAAQGARLYSFLEGKPELDIYDVAGALALHRSQLSHRAVVIAKEPEDLLVSLWALARGEVAGGLVRNTAMSDGKLAFVFSGQGSQWAGMGKELYGAFPVFRDSLDLLCAEFDGHLQMSLKDLLFASGGSPEAKLLDRTEFTQPALFALEVALYGLVSSFGVRPDYLIGHSIGELSAAYVSGVFSLEDACALVAARGRLMGSLPKAGAMLAVQASEQEVQEGLSGFEELLSIAAVNGPQAVVVSGDESAIAQVEAHWQEQNRKTTRLRVSHAFHSQLMEPVLIELQAIAEDLQLSEPEIPVVSNLTGGVLSVAQATSPSYWARHVRQSVRFSDGVRYLQTSGVTRFLELGPDATLSAMVSQCIDDELAQGVLLTTCLRAQRPEVNAFMEFLAQAHAHGIQIDWRSLFADAGARRVELPTYAFQRKRYWLETGPSATDVGSLGQSAAEHPLLGAAVGLAGGEGWLFTGRLSLKSHPWLADHAVMGVVLLPGTVFLELALCAGSEVGSPVVGELTLQAPLVLSGTDAVQLQVSVGEPGEAGDRPVAIYARPEVSDDQEGIGGELEWTCHASGMLSPEAVGLSEREFSLAPGVWPPDGAQEIVIDDFYDRLAEQGLEYGPVFQGLRAAWSRNGELFAEVALEEGQQAQSAVFGLHPALLDAGLHALAFGGFDSRRTGHTEVPFSFAGAHLKGHGASSLRVCICTESSQQHGPGSLSLVAFDGGGEVVLSIDSITTRPIDQSQLLAHLRNRHDALYERQWVELAASSPNGSRLQVVALGESCDIEVSEIAPACYPDIEALEAAVERGAPVPELVLVQVGTMAHEDELAGTVRAVTGRTLELLKTWIASRRLQESRLTFITGSALAVTEGDAPSLTHAALVGLVRSAHSEHPGRFSLVDLDGSEASWGSLYGALVSDEPELCLRDGVLYAPRLARLKSDRHPLAPREFDPDGTVLITGGTGGLGGLLAAHLASRHGVRHLLLVSRSGAKAEGASELEAHLKDLGCDVQIAACDVSDRKALSETISSVPAGHPLSAVVHAAGVLDDGVIESLDGERLRRVMAPKVDGAINLHELTEHLALTEFICFSSVAGTLGGPGQGNYAAANAFLDALAYHRRAQGLPGLSLALGAWSTATGMTGDPSESDRARLARLGIIPFSDELGLELFDAARSIDKPLLLPVRLDGAALRAQARAGILPALMRGLVRSSTRKASDTAQGVLAGKLEGAPESQWDTIVLELVRSHVAAVLGHESPKDIDPQRAFKELGFDSLGAVELRNRLSRAAHLKLPSTLVFDYPTAGAVAEYVRSRVSPGGRREGGLEVGEAVVREALSSISLSRLREAGLLESLMELTGSGDGALVVDGGDAGELDTMDVASLVQHVLEDGELQSKVGGS